MAESLTLVDIPNDPLLHVFSYLSYKDLVSCGQVCQRLRTLAHHDSLWKRKLKIHQAEYELPNSPDIIDNGGLKSWRCRFIDWYKEYGRYTDCYIPICRAWKQIEKFVAQNIPKVSKSIQEGATEEELNALEARLGLKLPNSLRFAYRIHSGQNEGSPIGILGGVQNYNHRRSERLLPLNDIINLHHRYVDQCCYPTQFIPVSYCVYSNLSTFLLAGDEDFHRILPRGCLFYLCSSVNNQHNQYNQHNRDIFISGDSFLDWFCRYAQELEDETFYLEHNNILRFYHNPEFVATTEHVRISVATAFVPEMSHVTPQRDSSPEPSQILHAYRITLSMDEHAPTSAACQLETRHWSIVDETGHEETVSGPGVIGAYPIVKPGTTWSYISCTHFKTMQGWMSGTYTMKKLNKPDVKFDAIVPRFHMSVSKFITLPEAVTKEWRY